MSLPDHPPGGPRRARNGRTYAPSNSRDAQRRLRGDTKVHLWLEPEEYRLLLAFRIREHGTNGTVLSRLLREEAQRLTHSKETKHEPGGG